MCSPGLMGESERYPEEKNVDIWNRHLCDLLSTLGTKNVSALTVLHGALGSYQEKVIDINAILGQGEALAVAKIGQKDTHSFFRRKVHTSL